MRTQNGVDHMPCMTPFSPSIGQYSSHLRLDYRPMSSQNPYNIMTNCLCYLVSLQLTKPQSQVKRRDGKREREKNQEQWKDGDKHRNNQEQIRSMSGTRTHI